MDDLTSEGRDLLLSKVILSEDDYMRGCERPSDLESEFYKDIVKLGPSYKKEIERIDLDVSFEASGSKTSKGVTKFFQKIINRIFVQKFFQENEATIFTVAGDDVVKTASEFTVTPSKYSRDDVRTYIDDVKVTNSEKLKEDSTG
ncbi:hypothetical protein Tco_1411175 [Tanacetum coccineum]